MASDALRLRALADMVESDPARAAAELRAWAEEPEPEPPHTVAGRASAAARRRQTESTRAGALAIARSVRRTKPAASQEEVAAGVKARLGSLVPGEDGLRRWVRAWEAADELPVRCAATR